MVGGAGRTHVELLLECKGSPARWQQDSWKVRGTVGVFTSDRNAFNQGFSPWLHGDVLNAALWGNYIRTSEMT